VPVAVAAPVLVDVDPPPVPVVVGEVALPVVDVASDPVDDSLDDVVPDGALDELVEDVPVVSAEAKP
jgi:hypothetical protein